MIGYELGFMAVNTLVPEKPLVAQIRHYRWLICGLLFLATTINYVDRQILSLLKPTLDTQLHWTDTQFGMVNAAFQAAYAVGLLGFGRLVDRVGTKIGYAVAIVAWSLAAIGHSFVSTINGFLVARIFLGLGEGGSFPSAIKTVALWFPKRERALATSLFNSGANFGPVLAPLAVPLIANQFGWQACFVVAGAAGIAWLGLWLPLYDTPRQQRRLAAEELSLIESDSSTNTDQNPQLKPRWSDLLKYRQAWAFIVAKLLTDPIWWFLLTWLPDYFKKTRGLNVSHSGIHLATIYSMATVLSIVGGWIPGRLIHRGWSVSFARKSCMLASAMCVVPIAFATHVSNWNAVLLIGLAASAHQAWSANLYSTVGDTFSKAQVASLVGIGSMAGSTGAIFFPIGTGMLLDHFQHLGNVTQGYAILFGICSVAYLLAFAINQMLAPRFEPV
jgi:ACS family hexuronate transporter-like MFS transporter